MKQLTVRGLEKELEARLRTYARKEGLSLSQAAVQLMRRGAGLDPKEGEERIGHALDAFFGTASAKETARLEAEVAIFNRVDEELWT